jgi:hypothetical protein
MTIRRKVITLRPLSRERFSLRVAAARIRAYLMSGQGRNATPDATMTRTISQDIAAEGRTTPRPVVVGLAIAVGLLVAATGALWFHYGTAVFYETILAGLNACF